MKLISPRLMLAATVMLTAAGCHNASSPTSTTPPAPLTQSGKPAAPPPPVSDADLTKARVNEAGMVPILEYHRIRAGKTPYDRTAEAFRADLERLYSEGYRPVALHDYLNNKIEAPLGTTPVVMTFDDSDRTQYWLNEDGSVDPECAVGILKAFHDKHPDFATRAVFFVNSPRSFEQPALAEKKMKDLLAMGFELGNHTRTHRSLKKLADSEVQKEIGGCAADIKKLAPESVVDTLALPFGISPKNRALAAEGEWEGQKYVNRAVLRVGAGPALSPVALKFDPLRLPRIQAVETELGSTYWLDWFKAHPEKRYVSDGDASTLTVPKSEESKVSAEKLNGAKLRSY